MAGVDCSTQNTKVVVCDADTGEVVREGRAPHPDVTEVDARVWWQAWEQASADVLDGVEAVSVGGQQHGMVLVDEAGTPVRDALLWNDNRSAPQAATLIEELGGPQAWADTTGVVPVASFTVTKLRWVADHEPDVAARAQGVLLPHDWITHQLRGGAGEPTTDRGDASGTGYWSAAAGAYRPDLLRTAFGRELAVPRVAGPREAVGETPTGLVLAPGTGDNMGAALGLEPRARRRGGLARHQRHRVRGLRASHLRPQRDRRRVRRRDRAVPAARVHAERRPGDRGGADDGRRRARPTSTGSRCRSRTPPGWCCCPSSTASAPLRCPTRPGCCTA